MPSARSRGERNLHGLCSHGVDLVGIILHFEPEASQK